MAPVRIVAGDSTLVTYAMFDQGANASAVSAEIAQELGLESWTTPATVASYGHKTYGDVTMANFYIEPLDGSCSIPLYNVLVSDILTTEDEKPPKNSDIQDLDYLKDSIAFEDIESDTVGLILSAELAWTWQQGEALKGAVSQPIAIETIFGYALVGPKGKGPIDPIQMNCMTLENQVLKDQIQDLFRKDFLIKDPENYSPNKTFPSLNDEYALKQMKANTRFDTNLGRYVVGLPWRESREAAAKRLNGKETSANAKSRLLKTAARMRREPALREGVTKAMKEMVDAGHATPVIPTDMKDNKPRWYLPLHVDTKKPGKFRPCHNGASRVGGMCLNDELLTGPDLLNSLVGVLWRFR